ncbi:ABC transporter ATP-binding protein [Arthrobacter silvisoli]|uniref:ABC transporter ATP-binding protein n=1 Tax=Arthrobacter silvisoli TaxID=2291022 RepID=UPI000E21AB0A|nr:ABC transporter ATP-binding protein [Arthrobacter silvisoli]
MNAAIEAVGLTKDFGRKRALDAIDLSVEEGSIFAFLGPNGAGKTTMIRLLTGLARPSAGSLRVLGRAVASADNAVRASIGYLADVPAFYNWMTARETMRFVGSLYGMTGVQLEQRAELLLDLAGLGGVGARIGEYSRGMRQRLGVAQALISAPRLLLLDEPTSALDPMGRKDVLDLIASLRGRTTVFFSTHILADAERVCDTVAILNRGHVVVQAPMEELKQRYSKQKILVEVTGGAEALAAAIAASAWASSISLGTGGVIEITVNDLAAAQHAIPVLLSSHGAGIERLTVEELDLEEVFVQLVGGARS